MLPWSRGRFAAFAFSCLFGLVVLDPLHVSAAPAAPTQPVPGAADLDTFGIGINFDEICDLHAGATISDKCYGFIGAIAEIVITDRLSGLPHRAQTCIPRGQTIPQIFEKIRPFLRVRVCAGFCTQTGYVISSLHQAYRCPTDK
jgi:hypothetical protein